MQSKTGKADERVSAVVQRAAAAAFFIFLPFLVVDKGLFQYCGDFNSQQIPFYTYMNGFVKNSAGQWAGRRTSVPRR